jgi:S-formylglutathione hydrolase FrmB
VGTPVGRRRIVAAGVLVAVVIAAAWLVLGGGPDGSAEQRGARVERIDVDSAAVGRRLPVSVVLPAGADRGSRRPLLVFLHGRGNDERTYLVQEFFDALDRLGSRAPVVAFPNGGEASYWHDRRDGAWGRYVVREVIPRVARRFDTDRRRVAIGGISMGGFGAYDIARANPGRFCAVGGHSPALWQSAGETAPGAFDDAEDFARHDVVAVAQSQPGAFTAQPVWIDSGDEDPFRPGIEAFAAALRPAITAKTWPGGHDGDYWNRHWGSYLRFYARALRRCRGPAGNR